MEKLEILTPKNPILRQKMPRVTRIDDELQTLIDNMIFTNREANGVGLAAPQVGRRLQLAIIETPPEQDEDGNEIVGTRELYVIINPEITWRSRKLVEGMEGCLSIPGYVGEVDRHESIRVRGLDRYGKKFDMRLRGWTARIFQHEVDHLNGILYIDRLTAPENFWTEEEYKKMVEEGNEEAEEALEAGTIAS